MRDSQQRFLVQHGFAKLEQCCNHLKQCRNNVSTLCCAKNHRCESSHVTSPLVNKLMMESSPERKEVQSIGFLIKLEVLKSCKAVLHSVDMSL